MSSSGNANTIGTRQVLSYGGNFRFNNFDLSIAPLGSNRTEAGVYVQDEIFLTDKFRLNIGARVDKFDEHRRRGVLAAPGGDFQAGRRSRRSACRSTSAFRSPSLINNYSTGRIINQIDLAQINPAFAAAGAATSLRRARGRQPGPPQERSIRPSRSATPASIKQPCDGFCGGLLHEEQDEIFFTQTGRYRATNPPPGWLQALRRCRRPGAGGARSAAAAVPLADARRAPPAGFRRSSAICNLGEVTEQGHRARHRRGRRRKR